MTHDQDDMSGAVSRAAHRSTLTPSRSTLAMDARVWKEIWRCIGAREPESGGVLLGPTGRDVVTEFFFDEGARCTGGTYTPDHNTINARFRSDWKPRNLEFRGVVHSHPAWFGELSAGDLDYIRRILACNPAMPRFLAPIVIPERFRIRPFVVHRASMTVEEAVLEVIDSD